THFDHIGQIARENSARLIKTYLEGLHDAGAQLPAIVSGDFNAEPAEKAYQAMVDAQDKFLLFDSRPAAATAGTFCGFKVNGMPCKTIDFIFHTKEWVARNYQVITDNDGTYYPSDHLPVMVEFDLALEK
ncbi:MAG TPA: endonuclease/exonuclease/phosphatase family protein, partial [Cyclobacteriaceae bacterium]|nr:endonuclease/exonuclease/phosphatase family protein [Cyclobacteriaceae bacterium]